MLTWQAAGAVFFAYLIVVSAWLRPPGAAGRRLRVSAVGGLILVAGSLFTTSRLLIDWLLPPIVLLVAYWSSGFVFMAPDPRQERALAWLDERLSVREWSARIPRLIAEVLEAAYASVYPMIPLALAIHLAYSPSPS